MARKGSKKRKAARDKRKGKQVPTPVTPAAVNSGSRERPLAVG